MDLRAITNVDGDGDYSSSSRVNTNVPWDPGVRLAHDQRQIHSPLRPVLPAPSRSGPSDLRAHHKDFERTSSFSRVSTKGVRPNISAQRDRMDVNTDEDEDEGEDEDDDEDGDDAPFVPRDSSTSTTRFQHDRDHRLDLHATRLTHPSGLHISSHATRMATDPTYRASNSNHDRNAGRTSISAEMAFRRRRRRRRSHSDDDDDDDDDGHDDDDGEEEEEEELMEREESERYRPRPRRRSTDLDTSLKFPPPKLIPRRRRHRPFSPLAVQSPGSDSASSQSQSRSRSQPQSQSRLQRPTVLTTIAAARESTSFSGSNDPKRLCMEVEAGAARRHSDFGFVVGHGHGSGHRQRADEVTAKATCIHWSSSAVEDQLHSRALAQLPTHGQSTESVEAQNTSVDSAEEWLKSPTSQPPPPPRPLLPSPPTPPQLSTSSPRVVQTQATMPLSEPISTPNTHPASTPAPASDTPEAANSGMLSDSELADETIHLRALLGCPPGATVGLAALADPLPGEKPNYPLPTLIKLAIYGSPKRRLTLQEIYQTLEDRFEWFRVRTDELSWKNSIRHNLSLRKCFLKVQRPITEPGKGSYWMIDLTQGEGNKRVRKRNKKPTKGQIAAQVAAEAYRASSTRLPEPAQGNGSRPTPYPLPSHAHTHDGHAQPQAVVEDDHQVSSTETNVATIVAASAREIKYTLSLPPARSAGPSSPRQHRQRYELQQQQQQQQQQQKTLYQTTPVTHSQLSSHHHLHHQDNQHVEPVRSYTSSYGIDDDGEGGDATDDVNIDPALRGSVAYHGSSPSQRAGLQSSGGAQQHPLPYNVPQVGVVSPLQRGRLDGSGSVSSIQHPRQQQHQSHTQTQSQTQTQTRTQTQTQTQTQYHHHQLVPSQSSSLTAGGATSRISPSMVQNLQQIQSVTSLPQQQQQIGTPRLPPMRTFNDLPAPVSPTATFSTTMSTAAAALTLPQRQQQQKSVSSLSFSVDNPRKQIHQVPPVDAPLTGFTRFAHVPIGFGQPTFGKPSLAAAAAAGVAPVAAGAAAGAATNTTTSSLLGMSLRPLVSSEVGFTARGTDKGKRHAESQVERSSGADDNGDGDDDDDEREEGEERLNAGGGDGRRPHRRRRFVPPPPRPGIEYVHGAGGGLVTSRRTSGRYDEGTVEWINRLDGATHK